MSRTRKIRIKYVACIRRERMEEADDKRRYIGLNHIESGAGRLIPAVKEEVLPANRLGGKRTCYPFEPDDVLFSKLRPSSGKAWVADFSGCCGPEFLILTAHKVVPGYLKYHLLTTDFLAAVKISSVGTIPRINWNFIRNQSISFPPRNIQLQIAAFLDENTHNISRLISAKARLLDLLKEKRQSLIDKLVTRGIDGGGNGEKPKKSSKSPIIYSPSGIVSLEDVPANWKVVRIKFLGEISYGSSQGTKYKEKGTPFIRATNVHRGIIKKNGLVYIGDDNLPESKKTILKEGDIIVVRSGAYTGDSAMITSEWEGAIAGFDMVFKPNETVVPEFIAHVLLSTYVLEKQLMPMSSRAVLPHLNTEELGSVFVVLPDKEEQRSIAEFLRGKLDKINSLQITIERSITLLKERRSALISAVMTGESEIPKL